MLWKCLIAELIISDFNLNRRNLYKLLSLICHVKTCLIGFDLLLEIEPPLCISNISLLVSLDVDDPILCVSLAFAFGNRYNRELVYCATCRKIFDFCELYLVLNRLGSLSLVLE